MSNLIYLLQVTTIFSVLYLLYVVFLEKLTFHNLNRIVLLLILPISIAIPFSDTLFSSISSKVIKIPLFEYVNINTINKQLQTIDDPLTTSSFNYSFVLIFVYLLIVSIFILRILIATKKIFVLKGSALIQKKSGYRMIISNVPEIFSYFNWIFIPKNKLKHYDKQIIEHEKAHIKLKHSWDVIFIEVYIAFFWFNPLLYLYRKSLKSVHEFQADDSILKNGVKASYYMQLLLQNLEISKPNNLYNYFNQSILKKRVTMMTKPKSRSLMKLKYILLLTVCILLTLAFTKHTNEVELFKSTRTFLEEKSTPPSLFPVKNATKKDISSHFGEKANRTKSHNGIDIKANVGTPVFATSDGIVSKASMQGGWGNLIVLIHANGYETWYAHLNGFKIAEKDQVKKGDIIGYVGNTGLSTGPHLHYEVKQHGKHLNPLNYLE